MTNERETRFSKGLSVHKSKLEATKVARLINGVKSKKKKKKKKKIVLTSFIISHAGPAIVFRTYADHKTEISLRAPIG